MIHKECNDAHGYGCTLKVDVENEEELKQYFYLKKTYTGPYFQNTCKECTKKFHHDRYKSGKYNYRMNRELQYSDNKHTVSNVQQQTN